MFGSKYSSYSYDQVSGPLYEKVASVLKEVARDDKTREKMDAILKEGGFHEYGVSCSKHLTRDNPTIEAERRIEMAYLLAHYPETFDSIAQDNIRFFHGTGGNALPSILKNGLNSFEQSKKEGIEVTTGETWSRLSGKRDFVSLTDDLYVAMQYAQVSGSKNKGDYGVIIGIKEETIDHLPRCSVHSDCPEVGIRGKVPVEDISFIGVPKDRVKFVERLVTGKNITVCPMDFDTKFYDLSDFPMYFNEEKAKALQAKITNLDKTSTSFHRDGLKTLAENVGRGVMRTVSHLKEMFQGGKKNHNQSIEGGEQVGR